MNQKRLQQAIDVLKRGKDRGQLLNMEFWRTSQDGSWCQIIEEEDLTEEGVHECGMAVCFGGILAVSPEWKAFGGKSDIETGTPIWRDEAGIGAIAYFLECPVSVAFDITAVNVEDGESTYYGKHIKDIAYDDVIEKLETFRT